MLCPFCQKTGQTVEIPLGETTCPVCSTDVTALVDQLAATMQDAHAQVVAAVNAIAAGTNVKFSFSTLGSRDLVADGVLKEAVVFNVLFTADRKDAVIGLYDPKIYGNTPPEVDLNCLRWFNQEGDGGFKMDVVRKQAILTRSDDGKFVLTSLTDQVPEKAHGLTMIDHSESPNWDGRDADDLGKDQSAEVFDGDTIVIGNVFLKFAVVP